jgi:hypothetical protein
MPTLSSGMHTLVTRGIPIYRAVQISAVNSNMSHGYRETGQMAVASAGMVEVF